MKKPFQPIFLIGAPRSGTTIVFEVLSTHPKLGWFSNHLNKYPEWPFLAAISRCCDLPLIGLRLKGQKEKAQKFLPCTVEGWNIWNHYCGEKFLYSSMNDITPTLDQKEHVIRLFKRILLFQGKKRLIIKLTGPPRIKFLHKIFPHAFFVHIIREPAAVLNSQLKVKYWKGGGDFNNPWWNDLPEEYRAEWISTEKKPIILLAFQLRNILEQTRREKKVLKAQQFFEINYEDFTLAPLNEVRKILQSSGEELHPIIAQYLKRIKIKSQKYKWKQSFSSHELKIINNLLYHKGYQSEK